MFKHGQTNLGWETIKQIIISSEANFDIILVFVSKLDPTYLENWEKITVYKPWEASHRFSRSLEIYMDDRSWTAQRESEPIKLVVLIRESSLESVLLVGSQTEMQVAASRQPW